MNSETTRSALFDLIKARAGTDTADWVARALAHEPTQFNQVCIEISKRFGKQMLIAGFQSRATAVLMTTFGEMPIGHWRIDRAVKAWFVASLASKTSQPFKSLFEFYASGDTELRIATLLALNLVDDSDAEQGLALIHDAGRTYLDELMDAAWCNHPFSATYLSDDEYRKAVLKALFCDVKIEGFLGLSERADETLSLSLRDFADEREAANRPVPDVLWPVLALHPQPGVIARLIGRLEHPLREQRLVAATALRNAKDARARTFIKERLEREEDEAVRRMLETALGVCAEKG